MNLAKPLALTGAAVLWVALPTTFFSSTGFWIGAPSNFSSGGASCSLCHIGSAPSSQSSRMSITAATHALSAGQSVQVTTSLDASGANQALGGFVCEATAGGFTPGLNTQTNTNLSTISVAHIDNSSRNWVFDFDAPATPGLVELTAAGLAVDGSITTGDHFSFSGFDKTATSATPLRLYVLPSGVTNIGSSCSDGYGNVPVLGASDAPAIGNSNFELRLHGASPSAVAFAWGAVGPGGFSASLDPFGINGCTSYIQTVGASQVQMTTSGQAVRGEGTVAFPLPITNDPALIGSTYVVQAGYVDPSVGSAVPAGSFVSGLPRSLDLTLTNGLEITVQ